MNRVCNISKELLENFLKEGKTTREIGLILGVANTTISRYIRNYNLNNLYSKPKYLPYHLTKIDSKELAYMLGFIIADSSINNEIVEISVAINDSELMDLFSPLLGIKSFEDLTLVKEKRRFPRIRLVRKIVGINKFIGGNKKKDRNVPIIQKDLEVYLIRGIFDADGCITWGYRKDRNRIWHKVSFTSSLGILTSVQKVLYKTMSCSHPDVGRHQGEKKTMHCGYCLPCTIRRASIQKGELQDTSTYFDTKYKAIPIARQAYRTYKYALQNFDENIAFLKIQESGPIKENIDQFASLYVRGMKEMKEYLEKINV